MKLFHLPKNSFQTLLKAPLESLITQYTKTHSEIIKKRSIIQKQCLSIKRFFKSIPNENDIINPKTKIETYFFFLIKNKMGLESFESLLVYFFEEIRWR